MDRLGTVAQAYNPSYLAGEDHVEDHILPWQNIHETPSQPMGLSQGHAPVTPDQSPGWPGYKARSYLKR
jgi:hypothetical protein